MWRADIIRAWAGPGHHIIDLNGLGLGRAGLEIGEPVANTATKLLSRMFIILKISFFEIYNNYSSLFPNFPLKITIFKKPYNMLEGNGWWICVQNVKSISSKKLRYDIKYVKHIKHKMWQMSHFFLGVPYERSAQNCHSRRPSKKKKKRSSLSFMTFHASYNGRPLTDPKLLPHNS